MTVILEDTDEGGKFFRLFVAIPNALRLFGSGTLKVVSIDGTHLYNENYDGIYVFVTTKLEMESLFP